MFTTGAWSRVYALDARSGELLWQYDPKVPPEWAVHACCDVVNRGVAIWQGSIFVGTLDGRLVSLDATSGSVNWTVQTTDPDKPYTITGAPRVVKGKVIIGNGGAEYGVRGYVSAYDAESGSHEPGVSTPCPATRPKAFESEAMERAAADLDRRVVEIRRRRHGLGFDGLRPRTEPALHRRRQRLTVEPADPQPGGRRQPVPVFDRRAEPGHRRIRLALPDHAGRDVGLHGHSAHDPGGPGNRRQPRKVIMQAPKNGFFYVLDRETGELISAEPYVQTTWASHIDPETGRPVEIEGARYIDGPALVLPAPYGGHNWHPMAYSPLTGLIYIPAQDIPFAYGTDENFTYTPGLWNVGINPLYASFPEQPPEVQAQLLAMIKGQIIAWDPVERREAWRFQHALPWNGGMLATAGNLVFQGNSVGDFAAYRADTGEKLWSAGAQTGIVASPVTYEVDGEQYVSVLAGWGGSLALSGGDVAAATGQTNVSRILTYKLGASGALPDFVPVALALDPPPRIDDPDAIALGKQRFADRCMVCHGDGAVGGGVVPDLRFMNAEKHQMWMGIVLGGLRRDKGMVSFAGVLTPRRSHGHPGIRDRTGQRTGGINRRAIRANIHMTSIKDTPESHGQAHPATMSGKRPPWPTTIKTGADRWKFVEQSRKYDYVSIRTRLNHLRTLRCAA